MCSKAGKQLLRYYEGYAYEPPDQSIGMLDARRCHYHAGKSASRGTRVAAQVRHARRGARKRDNIDTERYTVLRPPH